jgi:hypothetical protein
MFSPHERQTAAAPERRGAMVVRRLHAPVKSGFQSLNPKQFTYFSGTGSRESFGMPCKDYAQLISEFCKKKQAGEYRSINDSLFTLHKTVIQLARDLEENTIYTAIYSISEALVKKTGHIPIMLTQFMPAILFKRSARSIKPHEINLYFTDLPKARAQAMQYLVKHEMTEAVKFCLEQLYLLRYQTEMENGTSPLFYAYNRVIAELYSDVIEANQSTMPANYAQFDLFSTFCEKIHTLICQCDPIIIQKSYLDTALAILNDQRGVQTFLAQQNASMRLYALFQQILEEQLAISGDSQEINLTPAQDKILQAILPLLAYLNSEHNPFARAGIFGKELRNAFIEEALQQYSAHESQELWIEPPTYTYSHRAETYPREYDEEQIEHLLYGPADDGPAPPKPIGMFASIGRALAGFLANSATSSSHTKESSRQQRNMLLALPMPIRYLALEAPPATRAETDPKRP